MSEGVTIFRVPLSNNLVTILFDNELIGLLNKKDIFFIASIVRNSDPIPIINLSGKIYLHRKWTDCAVKSVHAFSI
jgi:hypothetical protein